jgi:phosphoserine aminotransferase
MPVPLDQVDVYYFSPQKAMGSDGGVWFALCSPNAVARIESLRRSRWSPAFLDLGAALDNSRLDQTLNTPAISTLVLIGSQLRWMLGRGGLEWAAARSAESSSMVYQWAERSEWASPFVREPRHRSPVVATVDLEGVDAAAVCAALRDNGIVDTEPYRKLGRNQVRIGTFPSVELDDVGRLLTCIDWVVERLT